eukprot:1945487-Prymnesium_polylepis.1
MGRSPIHLQSIFLVNPVITSEQGRAFMRSARRGCMWNVQPLSNVMVSGRTVELAVAQRQEELTVRGALA